MLAREVVPVDSVVTGFPQDKEVCPKYNKGSFCPSLAGVGPSPYFLTMDVIILFDAPLRQEVAVEHMPPSNGPLLSN
jgi:hypothetical protein